MSSFATDGPLRSADQPLWVVSRAAVTSPGIQLYRHDFLLTQLDQLTLNSPQISLIDKILLGYFLLDIHCEIFSQKTVQKSFYFPNNFIVKTFFFTKKLEDYEKKLPKVWLNTLNSMFFPLLKYVTKFIAPILLKSTDTFKKYII